MWHANKIFYFTFSNMLSIYYNLHLYHFSISFYFQYYRRVLWRTTIISEKKKNNTQSTILKRNSIHSFYQILTFISSSLLRLIRNLVLGGHIWNSPEQVNRTVTKSQSSYKMNPFLSKWKKEKRSNLTLYCLLRYSSFGNGFLVLFQLTSGFLKAKRPK